MSDTRRKRQSPDRAMSLDGFIAGGWREDWIFDFMGNDALGQKEAAAATGAMLIGRRTVEVGERMEASNDRGTESRGEAILPRTYVRPDPQAPDPPDPDVTYLTGDIGEAVATALMAAGGKDLQILGADVAGECLRRGWSTRSCSMSCRCCLASDPLLFPGRRQDRPGTGQQRRRAAHHPPVPRPQVLPVGGQLATVRQCLVTQTPGRRAPSPCFHRDRRGHRGPDPWPPPYEGTYVARPGGGPLNIAARFRPARPADRVRRTALGRSARHRTPPLPGPVRSRLPVSPGSPRSRARISLADLVAGVAAYEFSAGGPDFLWSAAELEFLPGGARVMHFGSLASWLPPGDAAIDAAMGRIRAAGNSAGQLRPQRPPRAATGPGRRPRTGRARGRPRAPGEGQRGRPAGGLYGQGRTRPPSRSAGSASGAGLVVITAGAGGCASCWTRAGVAVTRPAYPAAMVDTVGAGDAFLQRPARRAGSRRPARTGRCAGRARRRCPGFGAGSGLPGGRAHLRAAGRAPALAQSAQAAPYSSGTTGTWLSMMVSSLVTAACCACGVMHGELGRARPAWPGRCSGRGPPTRLADGGGRCESSRLS